MDFCENLLKNKLGAVGSDEPSSSGPAKGLKEGACQMGREECVCREEEGRWGGRDG